MLAVTPGEPGGIGPDIVLSLVNTELAKHCVIIACPDVLKQRAQLLKLPLLLQTWHEDETETLAENSLWIESVHTKVTVEPGKLNINNAPYVLATLDKAIDGCITGKFNALVTAPVQKSIINEAGIQFTGHTEYLAEKTNTERVVMMLATEQLRVALVTTHLPLADVPAAITPKAVEETLRIVNHDLQNHFGINQPLISVCGLNPHAGEDGHMGREEIDTIQPVINNLRIQGIKLTDALPADTAFTHHALKGKDAVVAMYHDQGLPVLKAQGFGNAVNITLGLPIIRTSVDHGTALDLAGSGQADNSSLITAINYALKLIQNKQQTISL